ncbi:MAG: SDR family NAD(P)-dependent oxidoreductase [Dehalococcoidia bacterium]
MSQVVIVTGAGRGLGRAIALRFGKDRARVVVNYARSAQGAEETAQEINSSGGQALAIKADVRNHEQVKAMVEETISKWGRIDVLVNNAGAAVGEGKDRTKTWLFYEIDEEDWDFVIDTNLKGSFNCMKAVAPHMMQQKEGHIINVSSGTGLRGRIGLTSYAASKSGIIGLTKGAARELGEHNIKVNAVCPGLIPQVSAMATGVANTEGYTREAVLHRTGDPEEFAEGVFNLSQMQNVSGQTFVFESRILH